MSTTAKISTALFVPQTIESAPEKSKPILQNVGKAFGFIPNLMATFANNPSVLEGYLALDDVFEKGSFTPVERQLILLSASVENNCDYCTAAHSTIAKGFLHAAPEIVSAIRNGAPIADKKTDPLVHLTREIVRERGFVKQATVEAFLSAGYRKEQIMELLLGVALKTISNYLDHISPTPLDQAFEAEKVRCGQNGPGL
jgi:AhpD family alkylhydroperoxidase